ncbi:MAG: DUF4159 domain-containing protein, partial [Acidobacteriota bacterium]
MSGRQCWRMAAIFLGLVLLGPIDSRPVRGQRGAVRAEFRAPQTSKRPGPPGEFTFARLRYASGDDWRWGYGYGGYASWATDYPKADYQFIQGLRSWVRSGLVISDQPVAISIHQAELLKYPLVYVVEPGRMDLTREDASGLREYLLRGGFMILDDFWGTYEWDNVRLQLLRIFPEYQPRQIPINHPIFHCYFDIDEILQIPNFQNIVYRGRTDEKGGTIPSYWGLFDESDRL